MVLSTAKLDCELTFYAPGSELLYLPSLVGLSVSQSVCRKNVKILKIFPELYMASAMLVVNITPLSLRDAFKKKKTVFKDIVPIRSDTPPP